jgi:L-lactate dehydrogenase (cytochrome)
VEELLTRAKAAGFSTILLTVDTAVFGRRERDVRSGFTLPPKIGWRTILDGALHPAWTLDFLRAEPIAFANLIGKAVGDGSDAVTLADYINAQFDPALSWRDVDWLRERWDGPVVLKGIQSVDDARLAAERGVDAVAVSNHGGRQLDGAPPALELVAPVADAVGDRVEVICDGGVRRGSDLVKARALGARACMVGRPYLYALGAAGERGVDWLLDFLGDGVRRTLALTGQARLRDVGPDLVRWRDGPG